MERIRIGEDYSSIVIEVSPIQLREIADKLEARLQVAENRDTVILQISNSVTFLYNVPLKDRNDIINKKEDNSLIH